jgi:signal transduction histidine kinase
MPEKQQDILITIIVAPIFFVLLGAFLLVLLFLFLRRQRKNEKEKEEMKNRFEQTMLKTQIEIQDQTLAYIASEIHDNIGQILFLAKINNKQITKDNVESQIELNDELLGKAFSDLREISHTLKNNRFQQIGLSESIRQLLHNIERTGKYTTELESIPSDEIDGLIHGNDIILFRIIQEIINNILKHAAANHINVSITKEDEDIAVLIEDNGVGFDLSIINKKNKALVYTIFTHVQK